MPYSIDGASTDTANIPGSPSTTAPALFNRYLFQNAALPVEEHILVKVVYNGNSTQSAPLVLDYRLHCLEQDVRYSLDGGGDVGSSFHHGGDVGSSLYHNDDGAG